MHSSEGIPRTLNTVYDGQSYNVNSDVRDSVSAEIAEIIFCSDHRDQTWSEENTGSRP